MISDQPEEIKSCGQDSFEIDIIIPVYNESENICSVLNSFKNYIQFNYQVIICYDTDEDTTLSALAEYDTDGHPIKFVKNSGKGVLDAIVSGFKSSTAPAVITFPADDDYNAKRLNDLYLKHKEGFDVVVASRFMKGGYMKGCPIVKAVIVRTAALISYYICRLPTKDPTNGLRLFSRRVIEEIEIESKSGFAYSMEFLVKCHRLGWPVTEVPFAWQERKSGRSRFKVLRWIPQYSRWVFYALGTTFLRYTNIKTGDK